MLAWMNRSERLIWKKFKSHCTDGIEYFMKYSENSLWTRWLELSKSLLFGRTLWWCYWQLFFLFLLHARILEKGSANQSLSALFKMKRVEISLKHQFQAFKPSKLRRLWMRISWQVVHELVPRLVPTLCLDNIAHSLLGQGCMHV